MCDCTEFPFKPDCWEECAKLITRTLSQRQLSEFMLLAGVADDGPMREDTENLVQHVLKSIDENKYRSFLNRHSKLKLVLSEAASGKGNAVSE